MAIQSRGIGSDSLDLATNFATVALVLPLDWIEEMMLGKLGIRRIWRRGVRSECDRSLRLGSVIGEPFVGGVRTLGSL